MIKAANFSAFAIPADASLLPYAAARGFRSIWNVIYLARLERNG